VISLRFTDLSVMEKQMLNIFQLELKLISGRTSLIKLFISVLQEELK